MNYYLTVLKKYAVFSGRARRKEYWMFTLFSIIFSICTSITDLLLYRFFDIAYPTRTQGYVSIAYSLIVFLPTLAVSVRRMHDIGKSGWFFVGVIFSFLFFFIAGMTSMTMLTFPFLIIALGGLIWILVLLCRDGEPHENKYGPNPKKSEIDPFDFMNNTYSQEK